MLKLSGIQEAMAEAAQREPRELLCRRAALSTPLGSYHFVRSAVEVKSRFQWMDAFGLELVGGLRFLAYSSGSCESTRVLMGCDACPTGTEWAPRVEGLTPYCSGCKRTTLKIAHTNPALAAKLGSRQEALATAEGLFLLDPLSAEVFSAEIFSCLEACMSSAVDQQPTPV